jgi:hypothetical protein
LVSEGTDEYFVHIDENLIGRQAGGSAAEKAGQIRKANRLRSIAGRVLGSKTDERAWRKGSRGERFNGWLLDRLPPGWHVFHDIPVGQRGANIDHVVVGPPGVFTVNTKNVSGKVWVAPRALLVNGHTTDWLPKAAREAARASKLLTAALGRSPQVRGVLSILADDWTIKEKPMDVHVGTPRGVKRWLLEQPSILTPREVNEIAAVVAKPSTWASSAG